MQSATAGYYALYAINVYAYRVFIQCLVVFNALYAIAGFLGLVNISYMLQLNSARFNRSDLPDFCYGDSREFYQKNLATQPADWLWRSRSLRYTLNSQGFRCPEWSDIDWSSSIVCMGCSMTFGVGVDDSDTWCHQLELITGRPVVNLGWPGASVGLMWANSVELIRAGISPHALVYYWPDSSRVAEFIRPGQVYNWGIWDQDRPNPRLPWNDGLGRVWIDRKNHSLQMARYQIASLRWSCARLDLTWNFDDQFEGLAEHLHVMEDRGRDLGHPGPLSHRQFAQAVAQRLPS